MLSAVLFVHTVAEVATFTLPGPPSPIGHLVVRGRLRLRWRRIPVRRTDVGLVGQSFRQVSEFAFRRRLGGYRSR